MGALLVTPCTAVGRADIDEARRALVGQGMPRGLSDADVARALWTARALPTVLDVLADLSLLDLDFIGADVELADDAITRRGPFELLAWRRDDELIIEVLVLSPDALRERAYDAAAVRMMFGIKHRAPMIVTSLGDDDITAEDNVVRLQRFTLGARGKSPS
jgi:hypothetical protein